MKGILVSISLITAAACSATEREHEHWTTHAKAVGPDEDAPLSKAAPPAFEATLRAGFGHYAEGRWKELWLDSRLLVELAPSDAGRNALLSAVPQSEPSLREQSGVLVWRLPDSVDLDLLLAGLNSGPEGIRFSQALHDGPSSRAPLQALPGGVIVSMPSEWKGTQAQEWLRRQQFPARRLESVKGDVYLLDTPPGLESLQIANRIQESGEVLVAQPNWWCSVSLR